ncbi:hypothetical protein ABEB36_015608 [Hypothenemus hampei]|uniref:Uncharacterized protein n=1 Tax=Hypothenemus hampei TaxID=57062 RepID=A0ABD1DZ63_HYPHA
MLERIETENEYLKIIRDSREPPFEIVKVKNGDVSDYDKLLKNCKVPKGLQISKAVKIDYFPNGEIVLHENYDGLKKTLKIDKNIDFKGMLDIATPCNLLGLRKEKKKDVEGLLRFLTPNGTTF